MIGGRWIVRGAGDGSPAGWSGVQYRIVRCAHSCETTGMKEMPTMALLDGIKTPADLKKLSPAQLPALAEEMRCRIVEGVSKNGGHLASNLGVVEMTIALHYIYDFGAYPAGPDRLLWDVGHQSYPHKMLTGRAHQFAKLRKKGSVSGFPAPEEAACDH